MWRLFEMLLQNGLHKPWGGGGGGGEIAVMVLGAWDKEKRFFLQFC